ncbi:MAG: DUF4173 domain-containing protein [Clostridia bacterium]|nr:DUF4173 domain-containing protein [Clostridia bacterium]
MNQPNQWNINGAPNGAPVVYAPVSNPQKSVILADPKDKVFALLLFIVSALFCDFALFGGLNLGFAIVTVLMFLVMSVYFMGKGTPFRLYPFVCGLMAVAGAVPFALHNDSLIRFVSFVSIGGLFTLYGVQFTGSANYKSGSFRCLADLFKSWFFYPFRYLATSFRGLFSAKGDPIKRRVIGKVLAGVAFSLPVLMIVMPLMMRSNKYFAQLIRSISFDYWSALASIVFALVVFPFLFALMFALRKQLPKSKTIPTPIGGAFDPIIVQSFLGVLSLVYLVYLFTQTAYFFSAFAGLMPADYAKEISDYARRGFFEMCTIVAINLVLLFLTMLLVRKKEGKFPLLTKVLGGFLCVFTELLIATALSKMVLYINHFGLTRLRVLTSVFMVFLAFVFVAVFIRLFVRKFPYMKVIVLSFCLLGLGLSYCDIDTTIARYNVEAYQSKQLKTVDVATLAELSDGAVPYLVELTKDSDPEVVRQAHNELVYRIFDRFDITCDCETHFCAHDGPEYYILDEDTGEITGDESWPYTEGDPQIVRITPKKDVADFREYNYDVAKALPLLEQYAGHLFTIHS